MNANGCSCTSSQARITDADSLATPLSGVQQSGEVVWEALVLDAFSSAISLPIPTQGASAFEIGILTINASGSIQTAFQAQVSSDGSNWSNLGTPGQSLSAGYISIGPIAGNGFQLLRLTAVEQAGSRSLFTAFVRFFHN